MLMISTRRTEAASAQCWPTVQLCYLVVSMLVIVVEDVVVPRVTTVARLDCDVMPDDRLADLLLVRVKPQLMVILDDISKAVRQ